MAARLVATEMNKRESSAVVEKLKQDVFADIMKATKEITALANLLECTFKEVKKLKKGCYKRIGQTLRE